MKRILLIIFIVLPCVFLCGCTQQTNTQKDITTTNKNIQNNTNFIKTYINQQGGYKLDYPAYFELYDIRKDYVSFVNNTCEQNNKLCFVGIDGFQILVEKNPQAKSLDAYYENRKKTCSNIKKFKIFQLPENFDKNKSYDTIRCEYEQIPKQARGGYSYVVFNDGKAVVIDFSQRDGHVSLINEEGNIDNIKIDNYDPLGDMIMRTFRFL